MRYRKNSLYLRRKRCTRGLLRLQKMIDRFTGLPEWTSIGTISIPAKAWMLKNLRNYWELDICRRRNSNSCEQKDDNSFQWTAFTEINVYTASSKQITSIFQTTDYGLFLWGPNGVQRVLLVHKRADADNVRQMHLIAWACRVCGTIR